MMDVLKTGRSLVTGPPFGDLADPGLSLSMSSAPCPVRLYQVD